MFNGFELKRQMMRAGLTNDELSERLKEAGHETAPYLIGYWQGGDSTPAPADLDRLATIFDVPALRFLAVPDAVEIPRAVLQDVLVALVADDARWALGALQGCLTTMGQPWKPGPPEVQCVICGGDFNKGSHLHCAPLDSEEVRDDLEEATRVSR